MSAAQPLAVVSNVADRLLCRLEGVQKYGGGWRARCPSHGSERNRSLSIAVADDSRVLIHCFAGCAALEVVQAVGLELADLYPDRITHASTPEERRRLRQSARQAQWAAALDVLEFEARIVYLAAGDVRDGKALSDSDAARLTVAIERVESARRVLRGR